MKKMKYERPSMKVVVLSEQSQLLAGSSQSTAGFGGSFTSGSYSGYGIENGEDL